MHVWVSTLNDEKITWKAPAAPHSYKITRDEQTKVYFCPYTISPHIHITCIRCQLHTNRMCKQLSLSLCVSLCVSHETKFHMGYLLDLDISVSHETKVHMWYVLWDLHRSVSYLSNGELGPATVEDGNSSSNEHNGEEKTSHKQVGKPEPDGVDEDLVHFEQSEHLFDNRFPERLGPKWNLIWTKCLQSQFSNLCWESLRDLKIQKHHHHMGHGDHVQRRKNSYLSDQWIQQVPMMIRSRSRSLAHLLTHLLAVKKTKEGSNFVCVFLLRVWEGKPPESLVWVCLTWWNSANVSPTWKWARCSESSSMR